MATSRSKTAIEPDRSDPLAWLDRVGGVVLHNEREASGREAWVAVVRTPPAAGRAGKLILSFGESLEVAARGAESKWHAIWDAVGRVH